MINKVDLPVYLRSESSFKDVKRLATVRCGNVEEVNKFCAEQKECVSCVRRNLVFWNT